jgi:Xaa-Pro aminopeptidase
MLKMALRAFTLGCVFLQVVAGVPDDNAYYAGRREALMKRIEGSIAVLEGAPGTREYTPFRQDNNFYYLTGVEVPNALLLIDGSRRQSILFLPQRSNALERWEGPRLVPGAEAQTSTGIDKVLDLSRFADELEQRGKALKFIYAPLAPEEVAAASRDRAVQFESERNSDPWDGRISRSTAFEQRLQLKLKSVVIRDLSPILDDMRRVKDSQEIGRMRDSGRIGALGLKEAIRAARPGMYEYQVAAMAQFIFQWRGAAGYAFFPIVGSGPNSCLLHYGENSRRMEPGDIVVIDFGPDYRYYESDITRTFPVSGKFSEEQAKVYQAVLDAQRAAIEKIGPGVTFGDLGDVVNEVLDRHAYAKFMTHAVGHYVGMSTHDVGKSAPFEPGVVIAVEPGVYMTDRNLGIRIEDTVLVTKDGCEVLTKEVPKEITDIEKLMTEKGFAEAIRD